MSTQSPQKSLVMNWTTLKGVIAMILFLIVTVLAEYVIVLYAINLGVKDESQLQWTFRFPGTEWTFAVIISPLFHLVPVAVVISLVFSWICLTRYSAVKPAETTRWKAEIATKRGQKQRLKALRKFFRRMRSGILKVRGIAYVWQKIHFARATIKSAIVVLLVFLVFMIVVSLLTYPDLVYHTIASAYQNNPSLLNFIKDTAQFFAPLGGIFSPITSALLAAAPGFRDFALALGSVIRPLANLDNTGKYLVFQNVAAWVSALATLFYGEYRKGFRYKKARRK